MQIIKTVSNGWTYTRVPSEPYFSGQTHVRHVKMRMEITFTLQTHNVKDKEITFSLKKNQVDVLIGNVHDCSAAITTTLSSKENISKIIF